jgi:hypothetical protein
LDTSTGSSTAAAGPDVDGVDIGQHTSGLLPLKPHWELRRKSITSGDRGRVIVSRDMRTGHFFKSMHCPCLLSGVAQLSFSSETHRFYGVSLMQGAECTMWRHTNLMTILCSYETQIFCKQGLAVSHDTLPRNDWNISWKFSNKENHQLFGTNESIKRYWYTCSQTYNYAELLLLQERRWKGCYSFRC